MKTPVGMALLVLVMTTSQADGGPIGRWLFGPRVAQQNGACAPQAIQGTSCYSGQAIQGESCYSTPTTYIQAPACQPAPAQGNGCYDTSYNSRTYRVVVRPPTTTFLVSECGEQVKSYSPPPAPAERDVETNEEREPFQLDLPTQTGRLQPRTVLTSTAAHIQKPKPTPPPIDTRDVLYMAKANEVYEGKDGKLYRTIRESNLKATHVWPEGEMMPAYLKARVKGQPPTQHRPSFNKYLVSEPTGGRSVASRN